MKPFALSAMLVLAAALLPAQWSANPATNLAVANRTGDQAVPKLAATLDGGAYVAWFDHAGANYDVTLQRLDANGLRGVASQRLAHQRHCPSDFADGLGFDH